MPPPDGLSLVGKSVVDPNGVEIGYVQDADEQYLRLGEELVLGRQLVGRVLDKVVVRGRWGDLLGGLNVIDNLGEFVGVVKTTVEDGSLQSLVVEDEDGEKVTVQVGRVRAIDQWIELRVAQGELYESA